MSRYSLMTLIRCLGTVCFVTVLSIQAKTVVLAQTQFIANEIHSDLSDPNVLVDRSWFSLSSASLNDDFIQFQNQKYGYSLSYPSGFVVEERISSEYTLNNGVPSDTWFGTQMHVIVRIPPIPDDVIERNYASAEQINLGSNQKGFRLQRKLFSEYEMGEATAIEYLIRGNETDYVLIYEPSGFDEELELKQQALFEQLVQTFNLHPTINNFQESYSVNAEVANSFDFFVNPPDGGTRAPSYASYAAYNQYLTNTAPCYNKSYSQLMHTAEDWFRSPGQTVHAVANGRVIYSQNASYPGGVVIIEHTLTNGWTNPWGSNIIYSVYSHLTTPGHIAQWSDVTKGQAIGTVLDYPGEGNNHVHFEMRRYGDMTSILVCPANGNSSWPGPGYTNTGDHPNNYGYTNPSSWIDNHRTPPSGSCSAPNLNSPANNAVLSNRNVSFSWNAISGCTHNGYTFRVCTSSNVDNLSNCQGEGLKDTGVSGTSYSYEITGRDNTDLWWGVKAAEAPNGALWAVQKFRIEPNSGGQCHRDNNNLVELYEHQDCGGTWAYGWQSSGLKSVTDYVEQASSIWIKDGHSARLYSQSNGGGGSICYNSSDMNFSGDTFSNGSAVNDAVRSIEIFAQDNCPSALPDLRPYTPNGWQYPVVPNSALQPTQATTPLYAGQNVVTFFDWAFINSGSGTASGQFHVEIRIDDTQFIRYPFSDKGPGDGYNWMNWDHPVLTPGQHVLKIVVDPDNRIAESDENNNEWQQTFTWQPINGWYAEYYNNETLTWPPEIVRDDAAINFDWLADSPIPGVVNSDHFSARWTRSVTFGSGTYQFTVKRDDGARVKIDGETVFEQWNGPARETVTFDKTMTAGTHTVVFEMFEHDGWSQAYLSWDSLAPPAPVNVTASDMAYPDKVQVNWFGVDSTHYEVFRADSAGGSKSSIGSTVARWFDDFTAAVGQTYYYWVKACRDSECSQFSSYDTGSRSVSLGIPTLTLANHLDGDGTFNVNWTSVANATGYTLQQQYDDGTWTQVYSGTAASQAMSGKEAGKWCYRVRASAGATTGTWSATACAEVKPGTPTMNGIVNDDGNGQYQVVWSAIGGATKYELEEEVNFGSWSQRYSGVDALFSVTGATPAYRCYRARALHGTIAGAWAGSVCTTVMLPTPILSDILNPNGSGQIQVSWSAVSGATSYELQEKLSSAGVWETLVDGNYLSTSIGRSAGEWCYRVLAYNAFTTSAFSPQKCTVVNGKPDLTSYVPLGYADSVIPSNVKHGHTATATLFVNKPTYFDWFIQNAGMATAGPFNVELWVGSQRVLNQSYPSLAAAANDGGTDLMATIAMPGTYMVKLVIDSAGTVDESAEGNNVWQREYTWIPVNGWYAEFYDDDESLSGDPAVVRDDVAVDFDWQSDSPVPGVISSDFFSARWTRAVAFEAGAYRFTVKRDDGARVKIDGVTVFERWTHPASETVTFDKTMTAGTHTIVFEIYEHNGWAQAGLSWQKLISEPGIIYISPTGTGTLSGKSFTGADILSYAQSTNTWGILYDGSYVKTPKNIDAFAFDGDDILISFAAGQAVAGQGTFAGQDIARFTPTSLGYNSTAGSFAWAFDGSDVGLTTSAENIDALWLDAQGRLYLSTTGTAKVTGPGGVQITAHDEDVLRFTSTALGATTAGTWELYWDATALPGMGVEDIGGYWEDANGDRYVTIAGAFTLGSVKGNGKSIVKFTPNGAGGWTPSLAPGATFPSNLDGIEMAR